jgi:hypothetical protein
MTAAQVSRRQRVNSFQKAVAVVASIDASFSGALFGRLLTLLDHLLRT